MKVCDWDGTVTVGCQKWKIYCYFEFIKTRPTEIEIFWLIS